MKKTRRIFYYTKKSNKLFFIILLFFSTVSCRTHQKKTPLFEVLDDSKTGLHSTNKLNPTQEFNMFSYMYFYNGAGVGAGDFNNDGLIDLFFASNQGDNKIFLNQGKLKFKDVTTEEKIPSNGGWSSDVSVVDLNNIGILYSYI